MVSCAICKFEASSDEKLKKHMLSKHDEREFSCDKCDSTVKGRLKMEAHKNKHKEIKCEKCGESVPYNSATSHKTKCLEETYKCEKCAKVYKRKDKLKIHIENENCSISCDRCGKHFKTAGYMENHMRSTHQIQVNAVKTSEGHVGLFQPTEAPLDLNCTICGYAATKGSKLKRHMITHNPKPATYKSFYAIFLMCLWYIRMVSIFNGAQGNPGGDESFAKGQYCIFTERSGSADMDLPEVVCPPFTTPKSSFTVRH